ncbi:PilZ domain-containing protein [Hydrogenothermus marinus]|uniref:PilZ domain-containing protein n=1 Tax=Hydrogenothermus marinus TaxID=133270 RepID=A0A3M0B983_9AQUI|nr:PilZ domain-containing protein [Hydrogenothermus marinus]RMA93126.1 PilZ domain-containing protein [Hydrogenothermus marinus]
MEKKILDLLKSIVSEKEFFEKEKDKFINSFTQEMLLEKKQKNIQGLPSSVLTTIGIKLYNLLFLNYEKDPSKELYNFAYKIAESKIDLKIVLISSTLRLVRDFIDYILDGKKDFNTVKNLIELIDKYIIEVEKAYADYYKKVEEELHKLKNEKAKEEEEIIFSILKNISDRKEKIEILDFYKEVPVICKSWIKEISEVTVVLDIQNCNFAIFEEEKYIYLKVPSFPKIIKAKIKKFKEFDYITLTDFHFTELPQEKRRYLRVVPKEAIKVYLNKNGNIIEGLIRDISIGGIGIYTDKIDLLNKDDKVSIKFQLRGETIETEGIIRYILKESKRAGIEFIKNTEIEDKIAEYVIDREFEIIKELRI